MEKELQEIIQKNLPAQVGDALRHRLTIADNAEKEIPQLKEQIEKLKTTVQDQQQKIISQNDLEQSIATNRNQLEALAKERHDLDIEKLKVQLEVEKDKSSFTKSLALGLVRNQEFRRTFFDSKDGPEGVDQYGNTIYATHTQSTTETKTAE